jgi:hypothetical protein
VFDRPLRFVIVIWSLGLILTLSGSSVVRAQNAPPDAKPAAGADAPAAEKPEAEAGAVAPLPGPPPIPEVKLGPVLHTVPTRRSPSFNVQMVDAALLPRDKAGIWVLDFAFKPIRLRTVEIPGKGRRIIYYLYYRVVNRTGQPRMFAPQFTVVTDSGKRYEDTVLPQAIKIIKAREDDSIPLLGAVDIMGYIPPSTKQGVDDAVYGVAIWEGIDPKADRFSVFVRGISDGYQEITPPDGSKPIVKYKTLRIDFIRRGDERRIDEKEILLNDPPYEWIYW